VRDVERPAQRACLDDRKLPLRLELAKRAVCGRTGDRRYLFLDGTVVMVRWPGLQERVQTNAAERY
jgi:hypothetical protein